MSREKLSQSYQSTFWILNKFAEGVTPEEGVMTPSFQGNSFNWVLGHILTSRDRALELLGASGVLTEAQGSLYKSGSDPVTAENPGIPLPQLLVLLAETQTALTAVLESVPDEVLTRVVNEENGQTVADELAGLHWHETYHLGQLELLRQVGSRKDAFP